MQRKAQLVFSSKNFSRQNILSCSCGSSPSAKLFEGILKGWTTTNRLSISRDKYFYQPSEEYIKHSMMFKKKKS